MLSVEQIKKTTDEFDGYFGTITKYSKVNGYIDEDLFQEQLIKFYETKEIYDSDKSKFNTLLSTILKRNRSNYVRDEVDKYKDHEISYDNDDLKMFESESNIEENHMTKELIEAFEDFKSDLKDKEQFVIEKRIKEDLTLQEVSDIMGITRQGVDYIYKKGLEQVKKKLRNRGYLNAKRI